MDRKSQRKILIIDDNEKIHHDIIDILQNKDCNERLKDARSALFGNKVKKEIELPNYQIDSAYQGKEGYEKVMQANQVNSPYALAIVDMRMPPGWDGIETIKHLWQAAPTLQVVICTAYSDYSWQETIGELGQTDKLLIIKKPFDPTEIRQITLAMTSKWELVNNMDKMIQMGTSQIAETQDAAVFALANLAESRDPETGEHLIRLRTYCDILAHELWANSQYSDQIDEQFISDLYRSSPLHDIGKVGIPDAILLKPGALTDREFSLMKEHADIGARALEKTISNNSSGSFLKMAVDVTRYHHERYNGNGYPKGLAGEKIPLSARITALADVFDALTSIRVYKSAFQPEIARSMIEKESGEHFDPIIVEAFSRRYEDFYAICVNDCEKKQDLCETAS